MLKFYLLYKIIFTMCSVWDCFEDVSETAADTEYSSLITNCGDPVL